MDSSPAVLGDRALNRALLARQLLLKRHEMPAVLAVERLAGLQAQAPFPPYFGLWTRLKDFQPDELAGPLDDRRVVRLAMMRSTVHLVTAEDCVRFRELLGPAVAKGLMSTPLGRTMAGADIPAVLAAATELLTERPLTNTELGEALRARFPDRPADALARHARGLLALVQVPPRGIWGKSGQARSTTAQRWLGTPLERQTAPEELVLRYLAAFGPASTADAQQWSGLTGLGEVFERLRPRLRVFADERGRELFDLPEAPRPDPGVPAPVRFLPEFDNLLLAHADRTRVISEEARKQVFTVNGIIKATILVNGTVRGIWKIERSSGAATLRVEPFAELSKKDTAALTAEGARLLRFAAPETHHEVRLRRRR
ncbi:winged helix DNA-binding domain-containing protein [Amycolatopsis nigrescens]|uniref:winged helix DNA-binding domain-containing protein n=1 Tax=Amycolatopsis nigrescens TaxID=381445 RepID=UPI00036C16C7|nr:winged helix DNA-binding domain-containing protein [Amycolatopsis nigrescens]